MSDLWLACLFGLAGGAYGAAIGANWAFVVVALLAPACWGLSALTGSPAPLDAVAFGPFFGPHVAFAGGNAATIFAGLTALLTLPHAAGVPDPFRSLADGVAWTQWGPSVAVALLAAAAGGVLAASAAELGARLFLNRSDSFIDPPALAIWPCATLVSALLR